VSPHNILLGANGVVKLTDFGLARARDRVYSLTAPGTVKGKLSYLAPEVTLGQAASPQSDLFGMGTVLWEALAGARLFDARSDLEVFKQIRNCDIRPLARLRPDVPPALVTAIETALKKDPKARYESARAMAFALAEILKGSQATTDAQQALGTTVIEAKRRLATRTKGSDNQETWAYELGEKDRKKPPPGVADPVEPPIAGASGGSALAVPTTIPPTSNESIDVEFSAPDLSADPLPLTTRKKT
jgi:serine/threonine protein kinase